MADLFFTNSSGGQGHIPAQQFSSSSGTFNTGNVSATDITNLNCTITTTGRPVYVGMQGDGSASGVVILNGGVGQKALYGTITFVRASTTIGAVLSGVETASSDLNAHDIPASAFCHIDAPAAGTYTYKAQANINSGNSINVNHAVLVVYEI